MKQARRVYMDHHATTPVDPRVVDAMLPYFSETFGNPASRTHSWGWEADAAVERARAEVASLIGAAPREIVFTSGATEANNLAIKGTVTRRADSRAHIVTAATEHKSVLDACRALEKMGRANVTYLKVAPTGEIDPEAVRGAVGESTALVSLMLANNEIGTILPVEEVGRSLAGNGVLVHSDATQAVGLLPVDVDRLGVDLLSFSAHKIYGPKGVGALYVRSRERRVRVEPEIHGGGHERGMRSGTLNVPGIVGFGRACAIALAAREAEGRRLGALRDRLEAGLLSALDGVERHGCLSWRLPNNANLGFRGVDGESLLLSLPEIGLSSGSACNSATLESSHVLRALGVPERMAQSSLRFGLGRCTTEADVDFVVERVTAEVRRLRALGAGRQMANRRSRG